MMSELFATALVFLSSFSIAQEKAYKKELLLMGSRFEITAISENEQKAWEGINGAIEEIRRIEELISSWDVDSQTSEINRNAGVRPVEVDQELFNFIVRAKKISKLTDGAFDISYASMDKVWRFDGSMNELPSQEQVSQSVSKIDYENIFLNEDDLTVFLKTEDMKIGFGAIGKGYAVNRGRDVMRQLGIQSGLVNAGGDLITWGKEVDGSDWKIGIADPKKKNRIMAWLSVGEMSVVTSGNYEKFITVRGKRYSHIIDPRSGWPVQGLKSVTIISRDAELSDALATSVFVLGREKGLDLINQLRGVECFIIDDKDELITSSNLDLNYYNTTDNKIPKWNIGYEKDQ